MLLFSFFFFNDTATTEIYTLSLHDALPISADSVAASRWRARYAAHVDSQPTPTASEPTSLIGTRIASPNTDAATVSTPISAIATTGVPNDACTRPSDGWTRFRRPIAYSMRVAATKLPLKIFSSDRNAPNRMSCAIACEPNVRSNATSVRTWPDTISCHGYTNVTTAMMMTEKSSPANS